MALILASNSAIRRTLLENVGLEFAIRPPRCDETAVKIAHRGDDSSLALALASLKACSIDAPSGDWVIGSDSVLSVGGKLYSKPRDRDEAVAHLETFSGRELELTSAVALAQHGRIDWSIADTARLSVRPLSEAFIEAYLDEEWPEVGYCVGVFRMEGRGAALFEAVEGSHFTILGLPVLPLLCALRERGVMPS